MDSIFTKQQSIKPLIYYLCAENKSQVDLDNLYRLLLLLQRPQALWKLLDAVIKETLTQAIHNLWAACGSRNFFFLFLSFLVAQELFEVSIKGRRRKNLH